MKKKYVLLAIGANDNYCTVREHNHYDIDLRYENHVSKVPADFEIPMGNTLREHEKEVMLAGLKAFKLEEELDLVIKYMSKKYLDDNAFEICFMLTIEKELIKQKTINNYKSEFLKQITETQATTIKTIEKKNTYDVRKHNNILIKFTTVKEHLIKLINNFTFESDYELDLKKLITDFVNQSGDENIDTLLSGEIYDIDPAT